MKKCNAMINDVPFELDNQCVITVNGKLFICKVERIDIAKQLLEGRESQYVKDKTEAKAVHNTSFLPHEDVNTWVWRMR